MKLYDLVHTVPWIEIRKYLEQEINVILEEIDDYHIAFDSVLKTMPESSSLGIKIKEYDGDLFPFLFGEEAYPYEEFTVDESSELPWSMWLGAEVPEETLQEYKPATIVAECLYSMALPLDFEIEEE